MINISKLKYEVLLLTETGVELNISNTVTDLGWEEGERELAMRVTLTIQNMIYNGSYMMELAKPGCLICVLVGEKTKTIVARGIITDWKPTLSGKKDSFSVTAYDELFYLQKSQDNRYIAAGTGTKAAMAAIFDDWNIPYDYQGPDVPHAKTLFKNDYLSDILLELLETAEKQGCGSFLIRSDAATGTVKVLPEGSNDDVYHFDWNSNLEAVKDTFSTKSLVTRVKVLGTEDSEERRQVMAVLDGKIEYGVRQRIYTYTDTDTLATAREAAQKILDEHGEPARELSVEGPDVPFIRKGDLIHLSTRTAEGYYLVRSVKHDGAARSMSMMVESFDGTESAEDTRNSTPETFVKGDAVILNGVVHRDSYGSGPGKNFANHQAIITIVVDLSRPCPYHLDKIGWVYPNAITKA